MDMLPSENSSKRTEDQDNPQEVFKMLIDLVGIFALLEVVVTLIFLLPSNSAPLYICLVGPFPSSRVIIFISLNSLHVLPVQV